MKINIALLAAPLFLLASSPLLGQSATKRFAPEEIVNPAAYYPEGPQITPEGLLVAEMAKDRVVLLAHGRSETMWSAQGCGPRRSSRSPAGAIGSCAISAIKSCGWMQNSACCVPSSTQLRKANNVAKRCFTRRKGKYLFQLVGSLFAGCGASRPPRIHRRGKRIPQDLVTGIRYSNGVLVQESRSRVLVSEMLNRRVLAYPLLGRGRLGPARVFFDFKAAPAVDTPTNSAARMNRSIR